MKKVLLLLSFLLTLKVHATSDWKSHSVLVEPNSEIHAMIDSIVVDLFRSNLRQTLCDTYQNVFSVYYSLGVSEQAARQAFTGCTEYPAAPSKPLRKQYYLSFASVPSLDSWTDYGNRTYLFVAEGLTFQQLKSMILHEMAISLDAKTNVSYTTYLTYFSKGNVRSSEVSNLRRAFNQATWKPLSLSFAALRAYQFELLYYNRPGTMDHQTCSESVHQILQRVKTIPAAPQGDGVESLNEIMAESMSMNFTPQSESQEKEILEDLLSDRLLVKNTQGQTVTFCQFMTEPLLTRRSLYSFYSIGPRPRLTGGSGGQSSSLAPWEKLPSQITDSRTLERPPTGDDIRIREVLEKARVKIEFKDSQEPLTPKFQNGLPKFLDLRQDSEGN